ncbi:hypothetical protein M378DRAFT_162907 [Amanita muscaria Koide BX008]|uniref:Uncharacterized protein n=1 Tax=Amanita muscaria (strain Koide BX008) TaxID=946122 RepID=A0A0C2TD67_AMAMK|nr:hypothetical protein M378DRAFT_162907 [Amanita muscaria Koide BX008]
MAFQYSTGLVGEAMPWIPTPIYAANIDRTFVRDHSQTGANAANLERTSALSQRSDGVSGAIDQSWTCKNSIR